MGGVGGGGREERGGGGGGHLSTSRIAMPVCVVLIVMTI